MTKRAAVFVSLLVLLAACGTPPVAVPTRPTATATPDVYQLALGNIQARGTLQAIQATANAIQADMTPRPNKPLKPPPNGPGR